MVVYCEIRARQNCTRGNLVMYAFRSSWVSGVHKYGDLQMDQLAAHAKQDQSM